MSDDGTFSVTFGKPCPSPSCDVGVISMHSYDYETRRHRWYCTGCDGYVSTGPPLRPRGPVRRTMGKVFGSLGNLLNRRRKASL